MLLLSCSTCFLVSEPTIFFPSPFNSEGDTVMEAVEFVLQNFIEMNKLWVRMQHQVCGNSLRILV